MMEMPLSRNAGWATGPDGEKHQAVQLVGTGAANLPPIPLPMIRVDEYVSGYTADQMRAYTPS